jgi:hypothetical protein
MSAHLDATPEGLRTVETDLMQALEGFRRRQTDPADAGEGLKKKR